MPTPDLVLYADYALLPEGLAQRVRITIDGQQGTITAIATDTRADAGDTHAGQLLLPAMPNAHSHVFQRLIAGLTERQDDPADDFWSWREAMYGAAGMLDPDILYQVAAFTYQEMLRAGYGQVCEFHYVHNDADGRPYARPAAMAQALIAAAADTGIALTLLPTLYQRGGFDDRALAPRQRRFGLDLDAFVRLVEELRAGEHERLRVGLAIHSLRAVAPATLAQLLAAPVAASGPIHIHIAEQLAEVEQSIAALGAPPIRWLYDHAAVDERWTLVHATHADVAETGQLARSRAVLGLCPTTEANLGDGLFPLRSYLDQGGVLAIGSDSHVEIDPLAELKLAEYGQRLSERRRNRCASPRDPLVALNLWRAALAGGAQAADLPIGVIAVGRSADLVGYDAPAGFNADDAAGLLSGLLFAWPKCVPRAWSCGRPVVRTDPASALARQFAALRAGLRGAGGT